MVALDIAGAWKGIHRAPDALVSNILESRRMNEIDSDVSVVYDIAEQVNSSPLSPTSPPFNASTHLD